MTTTEQELTEEFKGSALAAYMIEALTERAKAGEDISEFSFKEAGEVAMRKMYALLADDEGKLSVAKEVAMYKMHLQRQRA